MWGKTRKREGNGEKGRGKRKIETDYREKRRKGGRKKKSRASVRCGGVSLLSMPYVAVSR
jgi:hypothetical protein